MKRRTIIILDYGYIICKAKAFLSWQPTTAGKEPRRVVFMERHGCIQSVAITHLLLEPFQHLNLMNGKLTDIHQ